MFGSTAAPTSADAAIRPGPRRFGIVGLGGAVGAGGRWAFGELFSQASSDVPGWPWATMIVNLAGCLAIGFAAQRLVRGSMWWDGLVTGVLGGFTTMSAFAVELNGMAEAGRTSLMVAYLAVTLVGGVGAVVVAGTAGRSRAETAP